MTVTSDDTETFNPDSHILTELKDELAWVTRELGAANTKLAEMEANFEDAAFHHDANTREQMTLSRQRDIEELELHIDSLYDLYHTAETHFLQIERAFEIARQYNLLTVISVNLRNLLKVGPAEMQRKPEVREAINTIASALHQYCWVAPTDAADEAIRKSLLAFSSCLTTISD